MERLSREGIVRSMSGKGNCYDNAAMESVWANLKTETGLDQYVPKTRREAALAIFDHIECFYNPRRRHSALGYLSPVEYENRQSKTHS